MMNLFKSAPGAGDLKSVLERRNLRILQNLGSGAFGRVVKVEDTTSPDTPLALKIVERLNYEQKEAAKEEAKVLRELDHPHIIRHVDSFEAQDGNHHIVCILMELIKGRNLHEHLVRARKLDFSWIMDVFLQLLDGITYLHSISPKKVKAVVHRDLKPANILVHVDPITNKPTVKIADFGFAVELTRASQTILNVPAGTISYLPPEIFNESKATSKVDIYALGLILYQMITLDFGFCSCLRGWSDYASQKDPLLAIEDKGLRAVVGHMLAFSIGIRPSAQGISEMPVIQGWKLIYSKDSLSQLPSTCKAAFLTPFVSLMDEHTAEYYFNRAVSFLEHYIRAGKGSDARKILINLGIIPKLCSLAISKSCDTLATREVFLNREDPCDVKGRDVVGIRLLLQFLSDPILRTQVALHIQTNNMLGKLIEKFKEPNAAMKGVLLCLCEVPFIIRELEEYYALEGILYSMMQHGKYFSWVVDILAVLRTHQNHQALTTLLNDMTSHEEEHWRTLGKIMRYSVQADRLVNAHNKKPWRYALRNVHSGNHGFVFPVDYLQCFSRLILPMDDIIRYIVNQGKCTKSFLGDISATQYIAKTQCVSCSQNCRGSNNFYSLPVNRVCECALATCSAGIDSDIIVPVITKRTNENLTLCDQEYHKIAYLYVTEHKNQLTINMDLPDHCDPIFNISGPKTNVQKESNISVQFYTETTVHRTPKRHIDAAVVCVGLTSSTQSLDNELLLGVQDSEIVYRSDGKIIRGKDQLMSVPAYGYGDTVGVGVIGKLSHHLDCLVFFTLNGSFLTFVSNRDFPIRNNMTIMSAVGVHGHSACVTMRFNDFLYTTPQVQPRWRLNQVALGLLYDLEQNLFWASCAKNDSSNIVGFLVEAIKAANITFYKQLIARYPVLEKSTCTVFLKEIIRKETMHRSVPSRDSSPKLQREFVPVERRESLFSNQEEISHVLSAGNSIVEDESELLQSNVCTTETPDEIEPNFSQSPEYGKEILSPELPVSPPNSTQRPCSALSLESDNGYVYSLADIKANNKLENSDSEDVVVITRCAHDPLETSTPSLNSSLGSSVDSTQDDAEDNVQISEMIHIVYSIGNTTNETVMIENVSIRRLRRLCGNNRLRMFYYGPDGEVNIETTQDIQRWLDCQKENGIYLVNFN